MAGREGSRPAPPTNRPNVPPPTPPPGGQAKAAETSGEERYRRNVVEHGRAIHAALAGTTDRVRAFIVRRKYRLDLYPLEFTHQLIADVEQFERESLTAPELLATAKELLEACAAAMRVIAEIDTPTRLKDLLGTPESREQALMDELRIAGVGDGFGIRAKAVIAKVEGREA
jgi:hypothetical protein